MKLPRFTATTPPPKETGLVRAQDIGTLTDVGDAQFRAIEGAGRALQDISQIGFQAFMDRQALDDQQKMGEISIKAQESERLGINEIGLIDMQAARPLPNDPDYYKGDKIPDSISWAKSNEKVFADHKKRVLDLSAAIKNPRTRQSWINSQLVRGADSFGSISRAKYDEYQQTTILGYAKAAAKNGDIELSDKWIDIAEKHGLIGPKKAASERIINKEMAAKESIISLYRAGLHDEARKELEASSLSSKDKEILDDEIDKDEKALMLDFQADINSGLVEIDSNPDMTQADFNRRAEELEERIKTYGRIDGTKRRSMLRDLEKWRRGTGEVDYAKLLSLNQEMDAAQRSGIVDPTIENRITQANLDGSFGGRNKGGNKTYGDMLRRFKKLEFDERAQAIAPIVRAFERENAIEPELVFIFQQAKNKILAENPDMSARDLFIKISGLAESYEVLPYPEVQRRLKAEGMILMLSPDGRAYNVPASKKQKFLDNGFTEK